MTDHRDDPHDGDPLTFPAPVKLGRLDPAGDPVAFDRIVASIATGAAAERARVADATVLGALGARSTPAFAAAAAVLIAAGIALALLPQPAAAVPVSFAESAGVSRSLVQWSADNHSPTPDELLGAVSAVTGRSTP